MGTVPGERRRRGIVEAGLIVLVAVLAVGAVIGTGLSETALRTPDPLTWLRDKRGHVTRVNPETGTPVDRLKVGAPNDELHVVQGDGVLVVTNLRTNEVTIVDLSLLRVSGVRPAIEDVKVLLAERDLYLVNKRGGLIELLDPLTAMTVGQPWRAPAPIADAVVDNAGTIWVLSQVGGLIALRWSDGAAPVERESRQLPEAGGEAVLVAHERGVTVLDPRGSVTQVGTGRDRTLRGAGLRPPLVAADLSPADLVPVSSLEGSAIHLVRGDRVIEVDGSAFNCDQPGKTAVYRTVVYVPCLGDRKVITLDPDGRRAGPDLPTPAGGDPELVLNAGLLIVNVPGAPTGLVVRPDGTSQQIRTDDPAVPVLDPGARTTAPPPIPGTRQEDRPPPDRGQDRPPVAAPTPGGPAGGERTGAPRTAAPGGTNPGTTGGPPGPPAPPGPPGGGQTPGPPTQPVNDPPRNVVAVANPDGSVRVSWTPPATRPDGYRVNVAETGARVGTPPSAAMFTIVTGLALGQATTFVVVAVTGGREVASGPSNPVVAFGRPGGPTIGATMVVRTPNRLMLRVTVAPTSDGGRPITVYDVSISDGRGTRAQAQGVPLGQSRDLEFNCGDITDLCLAGGQVTVAAAVYNEAGSGPTTTSNAGIPAPATYLYHANPTVLIVSYGGKCMARDFTIRTCDGAADQRWNPHNTGEIDSAVDNRCIATIGSGPNLTYDTENCTRRDRRWDYNFPSGNSFFLENQGHNKCLAVAGSPDADREPVRVLGCNSTNPQRWTYFLAFQPGAASAGNTTDAGSAATSGGGDEGGLGAGATSVLLLPLAAAGLVRRWRKRVRA